MKRLLLMLALCVGLVSLAALYQVSLPGGLQNVGQSSWLAGLLKPVEAHAAPLEPRTNRSSTPLFAYPANQPGSYVEQQSYSPESTQPALLQPPLTPAERRSKRRVMVQPTQNTNEPNLLETPASQIDSAAQPVSSAPVTSENIPVEQIPVERLPTEQVPAEITTTATPAPFHVETLSKSDRWKTPSAAPNTPAASNVMPMPSAPTNMPAAPTNLPAAPTNVATSNVVPVPVAPLEPFPESSEASPQDAQPQPEPSFSTQPVVVPHTPATTSHHPISLSDAAPLRSNAGVTLEWNAPKTMNLGQESTCQLICRNTATSTALDVCIMAQFPASVECGRCEPTAEVDAGRMVWRLGKMPAGAVHAIQLGLTPTARTNLQPLATVTCSRATMVDIEVLEPQLDFKIVAPKDVFVGQAASYQFVVTNKGRGPAWNVAIEAELPAAMQSSQGSTLRYGIGTLGPGETRRIQSPVSGLEAGQHEVNAVAILGTQPVARAKVSVEIMRPTLRLELEGPKMRYIDRKASFVAKVKNPGPAPLDNVQVAGIVPAAFRFVDAGSGGSFDNASRQVSWFVGRLEPNETANVAVNLLAGELGEHRLVFAARADAGAEGQTEMVTRIEGVSSLVLDVSEADDPIEVGGETVYQMRITNRGSLPARRVQIAATLPVEMKAVSNNGPTRGTIEGTKVLFIPIEVLGPGQTEQYEVRVQCLKPGNVRFRAYFRSEENPNPVMEEEATRVYAD